MAFERLNLRAPPLRLGLDESILLASAYSNLLNLHNLSEQVAQAMEERHARLDDIPRGPAKTTNGAIKVSEGRRRRRRSRLNNTTHQVDCVRV